MSRLYGVRVYVGVVECRSLADAEAYVAEVGLPWSRVVCEVEGAWVSVFPESEPGDDHPDDGAPADWSDWDDSDPDDGGPTFKGRNVEDLPPL